MLLITEILPGKSDGEIGPVGKGEVRSEAGKRSLSKSGGGFFPILDSPFVFRKEEGDHHRRESTPISF